MAEQENSISNMPYYAHISEDGRVQTVLDHLSGTAELCERFAQAFGSGEQGRMIALAHDIGKCSKEFQQRLHGGHIVDHASAGAWECAKLEAFWAAACVAGHHGGLPDFGNIHLDLPDEPTLFGRLKRAANQNIPDYQMPFALPVSPAPKGYGEKMLTDSFLIRMLYSCLVDADYLDTERFMTNGTVERGTGDTLPHLLDKLEAYISPWWNPDTELNKRRCEVLKACAAGEKLERGIYTLTVPTGGGKTVSSMAFALHHAVKHGMDRIIYVIPYTSIIEQTAEVFRDIFGEENVVEHHSGAAFEVNEYANAAEYGMIRAAENWDAPVIVTTAVQFFESIYANRPSKCRKLHNMTNSVVIFDEAQMLPTEHLRPCVAAIAMLAAQFRSTALLCTATQPVLNDLIQQYIPGVAVMELCPDVPALFQQLRRVTFDNAGMVNSDALIEMLSRHPQVLCIVNSRKSAQMIYQKLPAEGSFHLSTLMYAAHRRAQLSEIRRRLKGGLPCRVVSTSLIEAGVDVDFPSVYREMAGVDSILQAAGRCNREGKRKTEESVVTVFEGLSATPQMLKINIGAAEETLKGGADPAVPETVERYFQTYRSLSGNNLDKADVVTSFEKGIAGRLLPFRTVAERFHFIDDSSKTIYIPLEEGEKYVQRLRNGERSRELFRKLGQYGVSVYEKHFKMLLDSGRLEPLDEDSAILIDNSLYARNTGLALSDSENTGFFI